MDTQTIDVAASKDTTHPAHHLNFGKILATVLLAAEDAVKVTAAPSVLSNPAALAGFVAGFSSIWVAPPSVGP